MSNLHPHTTSAFRLGDANLSSASASQCSQSVPFFSRIISPLPLDSCTSSKKPTTFSYRSLSLALSLSSLVLLLACSRTNFHVDRGRGRTRVIIRRGPTRGRKMQKRGQKAPTPRNRSKLSNSPAEGERERASWTSSELSREGLARDV